jgi:FKBP-type peptidyl-prolyl cis-trans isomerase SlyD
MAKEMKIYQLVKKEQFGPNANDIKKGMQFEVQVPDGQTLIATAVEVKEKEIALDSNHPLAGETLHFDVEVMSVRQASQEELDSGRVEKEEKSCSNNGCC